MSDLGVPVTAYEPLVMRHSWPLWQQSRHFELGHVLNCAVTDLLQPPEIGMLNVQHAGCWECDLSDNSLIWSGGVYDIFGLPRSVAVSREDALALYCEHSRAVMERLRAYAIKHRRGFTVDVELRAAVGQTRWMRLVAAPVCAGGHAIRLHGLKLTI
jgi:PAS domain-containing protein